MLLKFKPFQGPCEQSFRDPDTSVILKATTRKELIDKIKAYRDQNDLDELLFLNEVIEDYQCRLPENAAKWEYYSEGFFKRGFLQAIKGGISIIKMVMFPIEKLVTQDVAEARAKQCSACPLNCYESGVEASSLEVKPEEKKFTTEYLNQVIPHMIGDRTTSYDDKLVRCAGCTCWLRASVWEKGPFDLSQDELNKMKPFNCWKANEAK